MPTRDQRSATKRWTMCMCTPLYTHPDLLYFSFCLNMPTLTLNTVHLTLSLVCYAITNTHMHTPLNIKKMLMHARTHKHSTHVHSRSTKSTSTKEDLATHTHRHTQSHKHIHDTETVIKRIRYIIEIKQTHTQNLPLTHTHSHTKGLLCLLSLLWPPALKNTHKHFLVEVRTEQTKPMPQTVMPQTVVCPL